MEPAPVRYNGNRIGGITAPDGQPRLLQFIVKQADGLFQQADEVNFFFLRFQNAAGNLGQFKQGFHEVTHIARLLVQAAKLLPALRRQVFLLQELTVAENGSQGGAQIVGNIGNQLYLKPFAGDGGTDCFLMLGLDLQKLGFRPGESTVSNGDGPPLLKIVQLGFEMLQIGAVPP